MGSDTTILITIITIFVVVGASLPFINEEFGESSSSIDVQNLEDTVGSHADNILVSFYSVFISIVSMFFWTFGAMPLVLELFFSVLRIVLIIIIAKMIRGVG